MMAQWGCILAEAQQHSHSLLHGHFIHRPAAQQLLNQLQPLLLHLHVVGKTCSAALLSSVPLLKGRLHKLLQPFASCNASILGHISGELAARLLGVRMPRAHIACGPFLGCHELKACAHQEALQQVHKHCGKEVKAEEGKVALQVNRHVSQYSC